MCVLAWAIGWGLERSVMKEVMVIARCKGKAQMRGSHRCTPLTDVPTHCVCVVRLACTLSRRGMKTPLSKWGGFSLPLRTCWKMQPEVKFTSNQILLRIEIPASKTWVPFCTSADDRWTNSDSLTVWSSGQSDQRTGHKERTPNSWGLIPHVCLFSIIRGQREVTFLSLCLLPLPISALSSLVWESYKTREQSWAWHWHMVLFKWKIYFYFWFCVCVVDPMSAAAYESREDIGPPGTGIIGACESLDVVLGTPWVLWKGRKPSLSPSHLTGGSFI